MCRRFLQVQRLRLSQKRLTASAWASIFAATDGAAPRDLAWLPAHTAAADVGRRRLGNGSLLTARDRLGNDLADRLAKQAVQQHRVPRSIREAVARQEREVEEMACSKTPK